MKGLYRVIRELISEEEADKIAERIRNESHQKNNDTQVPGSISYYSIPVCNTLLGMLCSKISEVSGKKLSPTYSYCRIYKQGNVLEPHKDRPSCEYSVTLNLSQTHSWPIYMGKRAVDLQPGDGCLYKGCEIEHSRKKFNGEEYIQVFLHYIDSNGPYKNYIHDFENNHNIKEDELKFSNFNKSVSRYYYIKEAFTPEECDSNEIYKKVMNYVEEFNKFYNFNISEMEIFEVANAQPHCFDIGLNEAASRRKLTILIQNMDPKDYEGCEIQFSDGTVIEKSKGSMVIFPSYFIYRITEGTGTIIKTCVTGSPFR